MKLSFLLLWLQAMAKKSPKSPKHPKSPKSPKQRPPNVNYGRQKSDCIFRPCLSTRLNINSNPMTHSSGCIKNIIIKGRRRLSLPAAARAPTDKRIQMDLDHNCQILLSTFSFPDSHPLALLSHSLSPLYSLPPFPALYKL